MLSIPVHIEVYISSFGGGQFPGIITVAELGTFLTSFMAAMSSTLCPLLRKWSKAGKSKTKCISIVRQILKFIESHRNRANRFPSGCWDSRETRFPRLARATERLVQEDTPLPDVLVEFLQDLGDRLTSRCSRPQRSADTQRHGETHGAYAWIAC